MKETLVAQGAAQGMKSHTGHQEDSDPTPQYHMIGIRTERKFQKAETMVERGRRGNSIFLCCLFDLFLNKNCQSRGQQEVGGRERRNIILY